MKIGILTFHFSNNFGAALQAYALRRWFVDEGHDAEFVNYCPVHVEHGGSLEFGFSKKIWVSNIKVIYLAYSAAKTKFFGSKEQQAAFVRFQRENLGVISERVRSLSELDSMATNYDLLVCGSDQIWSPSVQYGLDPAYFLAFGKGPRKISFAASFGSATQQSLEDCQAGRLVDGLDAIAVREKSGLGLVQSLTNREAIQVVDPTCLLGDFDDLISEAEIKDRGHIFCYALRTDKGVREVSRIVESALGVPVVAPRNPHSRWKPLGLTRHPGPKEWLALIDASSFVVTNSFHGTMLSILLKKPFVVAGLPGKKTGLNDRMTSLLESVGLSDRFVADVDSEFVEELIDSSIDWISVHRKLNKMSGESKDYLRSQIDLCK